jgi:hypothetical protein
MGVAGSSVTAGLGNNAYIYNAGASALVFGTSDTERMRIDSGGRLYLNTQTGVAGTPARFELSYVGAATYGINLKTTSADGIPLSFVNSAGSQVGYVFTNSSSTSYVTSSDYRLKEDLKEINGLEKVSAIKVYDFKWKESDDRTDGVLAHELAEVLPYAVNGEKDGEQMQGVDYSKIVPVLVKAIQELTAKVEALEAK